MYKNISIIKYKIENQNSLKVKVILTLQATSSKFPKLSPNIATSLIDMI